MVRSLATSSTRLKAMMDISSVSQCIHRSVARALARGSWRKPSVFLPRQAHHKFCSTHKTTMYMHIAFMSGLGLYVCDNVVSSCAKTCRGKAPILERRGGQGPNREDNRP